MVFTASVIHEFFTIGVPNFVGIPTENMQVMQGGHVSANKGGIEHGNLSFKMLLDYLGVPFPAPRPLEDTNLDLDTMPISCMRFGGPNATAGPVWLETPLG
jgi:hypothetical protein